MLLDGVLVGMIVGLALTAALFFLKFWRSSGDRLFIAFSLVFVIEGLSRLFGLFSILPSDRLPLINLIRLVGYMVLIVFIVLKNRQPRA